MIGNSLFIKTVFIASTIVFMSLTCVFGGWAEEQPGADASSAEMVLLTSPQTAAGLFDQHSELADYLDYAFRNNAGLRAAYGRFQAALERIPQSRALDDPSLSFEYFIRQHDVRYQLSLTQMFPAFGTREIRKKAAMTEADSALYLYESARFDLLDRVITAFYEYHYIARSIVVIEENLRIMEELERIVTVRYTSGASSLVDLIKIGIERDMLMNELEALGERRRVQSDALAALLNVTTEDVLPWPMVNPPDSVIIDQAVLAEILESLNPELKAASSNIDAGMYREQLARRNFLPSLMLGVGIMVMPGMSGAGDETDASIMTGLSLPVWRKKYRAEVREAEAMTRVAINERENMRSTLMAELSGAVFKFRDAERRIRLFQDSLVPKALQAFEVGLREFASGKTAFMILIDAQRMLLDFRLMAERAAVDREIAAGDIGCCIGMYNSGPNQSGVAGIGEKTPAMLPFAGK